MGLYFPLYTDLSEKQIVVIGAGKVAKRRIRMLSDFVHEIRVISPDDAAGFFSALLYECGMKHTGYVQNGMCRIGTCTIRYVQKEYTREEILDADYVFACTDNREINQEIHSVCKCLGIRVNVCDRKEDCDFYFPSLIRQDETVIGISSSGTDCGKTSELRKELEFFLKRPIRIGTRKSPLALAQTAMLADYLKERLPDREIQTVSMTTHGDRILDRKLQEIGGKGLFVKELDLSLLNGDTDLCVHSLKDLPCRLQEGIRILGFSAREDVRDVLVLPKGKQSMDPKLPIGTSSNRRIFQLRKIFPSYRFESVRGNIQTRLTKLDAGGYSALILAAAGLKRLGLEERITRYFSVEEVIPAAGQGILAVTGRASDQMYGYDKLLEAFGDSVSTHCAYAERALIQAFDAGCSAPIGAHAAVSSGRFRMTGCFFDGTRMHTAERSVPYTADFKTEEAEALGNDLAKQLMNVSG